MTILESNLEYEIERWDDPGDYPSGAGGGPLPSYDYVVAVNGDVKVQFTREEIDAHCRDIEEDLTDREAIESILDDAELEIDTEHGVTITKWRIKEIINLVAILEVEEFEGGDVVE